MSSEKRLEQIFSICKNAVKYGTQEGYVDCPTREKGQYLGDAVVTAHAQVLLTGETQMLLKCIDQFAQTRAVCPGLLAVAPGGLMQEIADYSLMYPQLLALYYRYTGDAAALLPYYETCLLYTSKLKDSLEKLWKFLHEMFNCRQYRREQMMKRKRKDGLTK